MLQGSGGKKITKPDDSAKSNKDVVCKSPDRELEVHLTTKFTEKLRLIDEVEREWDNKAKEFLQMKLAEFKKHKKDVESWQQEGLVAVSQRRLHDVQSQHNLLQQVHQSRREEINQHVQKLKESHSESVKLKLKGKQKPLKRQKNRNRLHSNNSSSNSNNRQLKDKARQQGLGKEPHPLHRMFPQDKMKKLRFDLQRAVNTPINAISPRKAEEQVSSSHESLGYNVEDGTIEPQDKYLRRMSGIMRLYAAILITAPPQGANHPHPHGIECAWIWLSRTLNLKPDPDITATAIFDMLQVTGNFLLRAYRVQFVKLLHALCKLFLPKLKEVAAGSEGVLDFLAPTPLLIQADNGEEVYVCRKDRQ
nr:hypothetical protein BaRGS_002212 [Batillaria attramentaria]